MRLAGRFASACFLVRERSNQLEISQGEAVSAFLSAVLRWDPMPTLRKLPASGLRLVPWLDTPVPYLSRRKHAARHAISMSAVNGKSTHQHMASCHLSFCWWWHTRRGKGLEKVVRSAFQGIFQWISMVIPQPISTDWQFPHIAQFSPVEGPFSTILSL